MSDYTDNEEAYWFVRWIQLRRKYKALVLKLDEFQNIDANKLIQENQSLKIMLEKVKEDYQPKRVYKGRKKKL